MKEGPCSRSHQGITASSLLPKDTSLLLCCSHPASPLDTDGSWDDLAQVIKELESKRDLLKVLGNSTWHGQRGW